MNSSLIMKVAVAAVITAFVVVAILVVFAVAPADMPPATSSLTAEEETTEFLSSVAGLDFSEYALVVPTPPPGVDPERWAEIGAGAEARRNESLYPPEYCGLVKDEWCSLRFEAGGSNVSVMSNCLNGLLRTVKVSNLGGNYVYSDPKADNVLSLARTMLQRYQEYVTQVDAVDGSYLVPMQEILNNVEDLSPADFTVGNVTFEVSENGDRTLIKWIYTDGGVIMNYKRVDFSFRKGAFESFSDTWRIYSVGAFSVINSEEAYELALESAQNLEFRIVNDQVNEVVQLPDLSDSVYQMYFTMLPYRNTSALDIPSKIARDPLKLYPYWQFYFYFPGGEIGGYSGIQVGIWGDTEEIIYCSGFGFHDFNLAPDTTPNENT